ncbi:MAG: PLP-dependent aminotransferase family protein [Eggerthellaceae bacterium]
MLTYDMNSRGDKSLYEFLYESIRADIESGAIRPLQKLPSKRVLARHLGVSLITVEGAYAQLIAEGYVFSQQRRGYFAQDLGLGTAPGPVAQTAVPGQGTALRDASWRAQGGDSPEASAEVQPRPARYDFTGARPVAGVFPYSLWAKTMRQVLSRESEASLVDASRAQGSFELRSAIADYLQGFRGMPVCADQVVVGAGAQVLYQLLLQLLGRSGAIAVEDPGYPRLTSIYVANDVQVRHIPLDASGVVVDRLRESGAQVLHCMPSHQYPTGTVMSAARRREVLDWASECPGRYIIEDDYDCEFRLAGRPIPALQSIDSAGRVIYANTFTRSLGPAFRFGYMVLPMQLAQEFRDRLGFYTNTVSALDQLALARFMREGLYERHVNRLRSHYRKVQALLADAFRSHEGFSAAALDSGLHFILEYRVPGQGRIAGDAVRAVQEALEEQGIAVRLLQGFRADGDAGGEQDALRFVINLTSVGIDQAQDAAHELAAAVSKGLGAWGEGR